MSTVLLLGATGNFGSQIARALLERSADLRVLVRPGSRAKLGADISAASHVTQDEETAFAGVDTVVSAVQGGPDVIIDRQLEFLRAASASGAKRFIPSDYSLNFFGLGEGENINSDWRREFARRADQERGSVQVVHVLQGCFLDEGVLLGFLRAADLEKREAYLWGDGNEKMQFTTYTDTAAYVAEAALADDELPQRLFVAGDMVTFHELVDAVAEGLGHDIKTITLGALPDLDAEIAQRMSEGPTDMTSWLPLMYWRGMLSGRGGPGPLLNEKFPTIRPVTVRQYFAALARPSEPA